MDIDFVADGDEERLEILGDCAVAAQVRFTKGASLPCILKGDAAVAYSLTDSTFAKRIMDELCIDRSIMVRLLEMQLAEISTDFHHKVHVYEKYAEYEKLAEIIAQIPDFSFIDRLSRDTLLAHPFRDKKGQTPLMEACKCSHKELAKQLLDSSSAGFGQPKQVSREGTTALFYACIKPSVFASEIEKMLDVCGQISKGGVTPLMQLCKSHDAETPAIITIIARMLATGKAKPGHIAQDGTTALIWACKMRKTKTVDLLLKSGKSKHKHRLKTGKSAFTYAVDGKLKYRELHSIFRSHIQSMG